MCERAIEYGLAIGKMVSNSVPLLLSVSLVYIYCNSLAVYLFTELFSSLRYILFTYLLSYIVYSIFISKVSFFPFSSDDLLLF